MKSNKRFVVSVIIIALLFLMLLAGTAIAAWPTPGSSGDQYGSINAAMTSAASQEGIDPNTFMAIYNAAAANQLFAEHSGAANRQLAAALPFKTILAALSGPQASMFTEDEVNATCRVLNRLAPYRAQLVDYNTVFSNLSCGTRLSAAGPTRGALPKTGIAAIVLALAGGLGVGGFLIHKKKAEKTS